jgi:hypothetical protein
MFGRKLVRKTRIERVRSRYSKQKFGVQERGNFVNIRTEQSNYVSRIATDSIVRTGRDGSSKGWRNLGRPHKNNNMKTLEKTGT